MPRAIVLLALLAAACRPASGRTDDDHPDPTPFAVDLDPRTEGLLVWFDEAVPPEARLRVARDAGGTVLHRYARVPALFVRGEIEAFRTATGVKLVSAVKPFVAPAAKIRRVALGLGSSVALAGPGVNPRARVRLGDACFTTLPLGCDDPTGVGTAAARALLAERPDATIVPLRVLDEDVGSDATILAGLDWLASRDKPVAEVRFPATRSPVIEAALKWMTRRE